MRSIGFFTATVACSFLLVVACGGGGPEGPGAAVPGGGGGAEPTTFAEQVAVGQKLFGENCASCHGAGGEGDGKVPRVVGLDKGALPLDAAASSSRKVQFHNAADVGGWASKNMPPNKGGSLKEWQYWAIIAFDLKANGVTLDKKVDAASAKEVVLHK
jgi:mono/diheme cytochrome c family protein